MKRFFIIPALFILSGCAEDQGNALGSALGYSLNPDMSPWNEAGFSYHDAQNYQAASIGIPAAEKWKSGGFSSDDAQKWSSEGYTPDDAIHAREDGLLVPAHLNAWAEQLEKLPGQSYLSHDEIVTYANAGISSGITPQDVTTAVNALGLQVSDTRAAVMAAQKIHQGVPIAQVKRDDDVGRKIAADNAAQEAESARVSELAQQTNTYGADVIRTCGGTPPNITETTRGQYNPYSYQGKCFMMRLGWMQQVQWISKTSALFISTVPIYPTVLVEGDQPVQLGADAVLMGDEPHQYQSALGTMETPITAHVIKYFTH